MTTQITSNYPVFYCSDYPDNKQLSSVYIKSQQRGWTHVLTCSVPSIAFVRLALLRLLQRSQLLIDLHFTFGQRKFKKSDVPGYSCLSLFATTRRAACCVLARHRKTMIFYTTLGTERVTLNAYICGQYISLRTSKQHQHLVSKVQLLLSQS